MALKDEEVSSKDLHSRMEERGFPVGWCDQENRLLHFAPHWGWREDDGTWRLFYAEPGDALPDYAINADHPDFETRRSIEKAEQDVQLSEIKTILKP